MPRIYTSEQFWKLYENLPQELKDALFAEETGHNIYETCKRNEVLDHLEEAVEYVGRVLVGVLPPEDFQKELEKEIGIGPDAVKKVAQEINRFIFYPVKPALEQLYKIEATSSITPGISPTTEVKLEAKPEATPGEDTYREPVE